MRSHPSVGDMKYIDEKTEYTSEYVGANINSENISEDYLTELASDEVVLEIYDIQSLPDEDGKFLQIQGYAYVDLSLIHI